MKTRKFFGNFFTALFFIIFSFFILPFFSCSKKDKVIEFDESDPMALVPGIEWAVITEPYAAFRNEPGYENEVSSHGRRGDVLLVQGKKMLKEKNQKNVYTLWYEFKQGWLDENTVKVYDNKFKASRFSLSL